MDRPKGLDSPLVPKVMKAMSLAHVRLYRRTNGRLGGKWRIGAAFPRGVPVCLLTTVGRKSGRERTAPLLYLRDGERIILVASQGGMPKHPQWYLNLKQTPEVEIQVGPERGRYRADTAADDERARLWPKLVELYSDYDNYQSWTDRKIPVVVCEPI